ncbi:DNA polymerase III subunit gamma and tau [Kribbella sp. NPDC051587]|uniref:DNA polymerase III subunit gamma and tau n=1 Tax=Kribbella sp. NPDC051587 TaxID=3364119 RepID=UPI00379D1EAB
MEAPLALYRRYRPETFAEVIGQEHVTAPLRNALSNNRVNHAYLFSGPRGCGKTTSARILARAINCEKGPIAEPCGVCKSCTDLARGGPGSIDVIEIDAASHGGVDDARDLRERAFFAPVESRYKIYIIDEAHMVTTQGFNALLKLVEEPPPHLKFIFATTEPDKVIGTIRSRTHHYPFRLVPPKVLGDYMATLCESEGVAIETAALPLVVRAGAGSVRDSLSVLDQLIGGAGPAGVTYELAVALLGFTPDSLLDACVDGFAAHDSKAVFETVEKVIETGQDPKRFAEDLLRRLRDLVVLSAVPNAVASGLIEAAEDQGERLQTQAAGIGAAELTRAADIVAAGLLEMRGATAPRLQLELICAKVLLPGADDSTNGIQARLDRMERRLSMGVPGPADAGGYAAPSAPAPDAAASRAAARAAAAGQAAGTAVGGVDAGTASAGAVAGHAAGGVAAQPAAAAESFATGGSEQAGARGADGAGAGGAGGAAGSAVGGQGGATGPVPVAGAGSPAAAGSQAGAAPGSTPVGGDAAGGVAPQTAAAAENSSRGVGEQTGAAGGAAGTSSPAGGAGGGSEGAASPTGGAAGAGSAAGGLSGGAAGGGSSVGGVAGAGSSSGGVAGGGSAAGGVSGGAAGAGSPAVGASGPAGGGQVAGGRQGAWGDEPTAAVPQSAPVSQQPAASAVPASSAPVGSPSVGAVGLADVRRLWPQVLEAVKAKRRFAWIMLSQNSQVIAVDDQTLTLGMLNAGARESFSRSGSEDILRQAMIDTIGLNRRIEAVVDPSADPGAGGVPAGGGPRAGGPPAGAGPAGGSGAPAGGGGPAAPAPAGPTGYAPVAEPTARVDAPVASQPVQPAQAVVPEKAPVAKSGAWGAEAATAVDLQEPPDPYDVPPEPEAWEQSTPAPSAAAAPASAPAAQGQAAAAPEVDRRQQAASKRRAAEAAVAAEQARRQQAAPVVQAAPLTPEEEADSIGEDDVVLEEDSRSHTDLLRDTLGAEIIMEETNGAR